MDDDAETYETDERFQRGAAPLPLPPPSATVAASDNLLSVGAVSALAVYAESDN